MLDSSGLNQSQFLNSVTDWNNHSGFRDCNAVTSAVLAHAAAAMGIPISLQ
jgi:hypothetical protein